MTPSIALEDGPQASGVFARPRSDGRTIELLDDRGRLARTLGAGGGLVAATAQGEDMPVWVVTGTDDAGVGAAAETFAERALRGRFAVAAAPSGALALPVEGGR